MSKRIVNGLPVEKRKVTDLVKADYNPRTITAAQREALERSVERFGLVEPIVVNRATGNIVGGHQRLDALIALGTEDTDVVLVDLSVEDEKVLNLALNKIRGEWDLEKLRNLLRDMSVLDIDTTLTGFNSTEIESFLVVPDFAPVAAEEQGDLDRKVCVKCPSCGHEFAP